MSDVTETTEVRRGPGRPPNSAKTENRDYDEITYMPADGDPVRTTWAGIEFTAHIAVKVPRTKTIMVPQKIQTPIKDDDGKLLKDEDGKQLYHDGILQADGTLTTKHVEKPMRLVDLAKGNCRFSVNGNVPAKEVKGTARTPETVDEYRSYAMAWMVRSNGMDKKAMDARWANEEALRESCGCTSADVAYLMPFFEAHRDLSKAA